VSGSIVVCEKPSQAKAIRAAIGNKYGEVLPAAGHLLTLKEPNDVRDDWAKEWTTELLWPGKFYEKKPINEKRDLFEKIRSAARGASEIIIATDCDREGQLIGQEIVDYLGFRGRVRRAMFNAEDPKSLREAFDNLHPNEKYQGLYMSGQAREQADQVTNLSSTRAATVLFKAPGTKGAIGVGRVKTPVLGIVCKRELEILNFKEQDMFEIDATTKVAAGHILLSCSKLPASLVKEQEKVAEEEEELNADEEALEEKETTRGKILDRNIAAGLKEAVIGFQGPVRSKAERKKQAPPKLFDLTALQSACSAKFSWTGEKTLKVAQELYSTRTLITYPRGEAKHLPENNIPHVAEMVPALLRLADYGQFTPLVAKPIIRKGKDGHFSDKALEGLSHYAIIPNYNSKEIFARTVPNLSPDEAKLFDLIVRQYLAALAPDYEYRQTTVNMAFPWKGHSWDFRTSGRVPLVPGWKAIIGAGGSKNKDEDAELCPVNDGEAGLVEQAAIRVVKTRPPARYTEGALIKVMQEAWRLVDDPAQRARLKEAKGIGTPATRGEVLKGLLAQGQLTTQGKSLKPTSGGLQLYKLFLQVCPAMVDPATTALWETLFDRVEKGTAKAEDVVKKIIGEAEKNISNMVSATADKIEIGAKTKPSPKMIAAAKSISERKKIKLPAGLLSDSSICRKFLEEHLPKREPGENGAGGTYPPSARQLELATDLSGRIGKPIPDEARASSQVLSKWIDEAMKSAPPRPPSQKQIDLAAKLAEEKGIDLPVQVRTNSKACSDFIATNMGGGGSKGGTAGKGKGNFSKGPSPRRK